MIRSTDLIVTRWGARFLGRELACAIGRGGIVRAEAKREGDGATPAGVWQLDCIYWRADRVARPPTGLPAMATPHGLGWCDAPEDPAYNAPIALPYPASAERMARADRLYDLVVTTDHNRHPARPGRGSAIFVHCWRAPRHPTAGCVAFAPADLAWILARWRPESRLVIRA